MHCQLIKIMLFLLTICTATIAISGLGNNNPRKPSNTLRRRLFAGDYRMFTDPMYNMMGYHYIGHGTHRYNPNKYYRDDFRYYPMIYSHPWRDGIGNPWISGFESDNDFRHDGEQDQDQSRGGGVGRGYVIGGGYSGVATGIKYDPTNSNGYDAYGGYGTGHGNDYGAYYNAPPPMDSHGYPIYGYGQTGGYGYGGHRVEININHYGDGDQSNGHGEYVDGYASGGGGQRSGYVGYSGLSGDTGYEYGKKATGGREGYYKGKGYQDYEKDAYKGNGYDGKGR